MLEYPQTTFVVSYPLFLDLSNDTDDSRKINIESKKKNIPLSILLAVTKFKICNHFFSNVRLVERFGSKNENFRSVTCSHRLVHIRTSGFRFKYIGPVCSHENVILKLTRKGKYGKPERRGCRSGGIVEEI